MVETALREKWTDQCLDDLNAEVDRRLERLDHGVRDHRADLKHLTDETNQRLDCFNQVGSARDGTGVRLSSKRHSPTPDSQLTRCESWTNERIDDLRLRVSVGVTRLDGDIHVLRDDVEAAKTELAARLAAQGRGWLRRRARRCQPVGCGHRGRSQASSSATTSSGHWTDGRLGDFQHGVDLALAGLECDLEEIKGDISDLKTGTDEHLAALWDARFKFQSWTFFVSVYGMAASIVISKILTP